MKLIVILVVFVGGLCCAGFTVLQNVEKRKTEALIKVETMKRQKLEDDLKRAKEADQTQKVDPANPGGILGVKPVEESALDSFVFTQRVVPAPPNFLRGDNTRLLVEQDMESNAWVFMGSPLLAVQIRELAKLYDKPQTEMDLDFVLVLVSEDALKNFGMGIFKDSEASWLSTLSLTGDTGSLRLASGSWGVELNYQADNSSIAVLSQPVIRCVSGANFTFSTDTDYPIPRSQILDGLTQNSIDYRSIGFGLEGVVNVVGSKLKLALQQRNGSVANRTVSGAGQVPEFAVQTLKSSLFLSWWEWSVAGGIQVDREEISKGLFKHRAETSRDYLVIFVRPRDTLKAPPRALPAGALTPEEFYSQENPLLPAKGVISTNKSEDFPSFIEPKKPRRPLVSK